MAKSEPPPPEELKAPFFMLTFGDMMTLLLTFFVLLFSMSTIREIKFQAHIGVIQGALGISKRHEHSPIQKKLPRPSISESRRAIAQSEVKPTNLEPLAEYKRIDLTEPVQHEEKEVLKQIATFGVSGDIEISAEEDEILLILPTFNIFSKGSTTIDPSSPIVQRVIPLYQNLGKQIASLTNYDIFFVGHTDSLPLIPTLDGPSNNMELGFLRALAMYNFFFSDALKDKTRITFASQGDNVPLILNASLDSERRKNRRVHVHLKKRKNK
jgi:chemotaxis protein MotB